MNVHNPLISVVIAVYNSERYIQECIKSIASQIKDDCEVVLVDDGSTDQSIFLARKAVSEYSEVACKFKIHVQRNKGVAEARNVGVTLSSGRYIAFLDSDDIALDGYFEKILDEIDKSPESEIISFNAVLFSDGCFSKGDKVLRTHTSKAAVDRTALDPFLCGQWHICLRVFRRELLEKNKFTPNIRYEDMNLVPQLYLESNATRQSISPIIGYRMHDSNITATPCESDIQNLKKMATDYACRAEQPEGILVAISALETIGRISSLLYPPQKSASVFSEARRLAVFKNNRRLLYWVALTKISPRRAFQHIFPATTSYVRSFRLNAGL